MTAQVDMASVTIDQRLDFDIVLSTCKELYLVPHPMSPNVSKPKKKAIVQPKLKEVMSPLLKDIATMNMVFTFGINGSTRNVGLWAHQSVLSRQPRIAALISKLKEVESDQASPETLYGVKTTHVTEHSLESYCASIRFIYTSEVKLEVDLEDFAIGYPPNKPLTASCKNRPVIEGLCSPNSSSSASSASDQPVEPRSATTWNELFQVADCYEVTELREYCLEKIVETLDASTALNVLYDFAYRYPDLKEIVLQYVADNMSSMYSESQDPFSAFDSHPERHALLAEVLQLVFKAKTNV
ncbi:hypothetical protein BGZ59_000221 [Podila verticillata]|nr:hypothetical protein BGZ59_000221 [Podila verticillata]